MTASGSNTSRFSPFGWAAFLGVSWTWCIGMYLPILMVRDLGLAGYLVFAVPNVVGAAAMGWVLRSPEASRRLVERHRAACAAFSVVTIGYHMYWLAWLGGWAAMNWSLVVPSLIAVSILAAGVFAGVRAVRSARASRLIALQVLGLSLAALLVYLLAPDQAEPSAGARIASVPFSADALWMLPVSTLGFALCPYLDLTFHRARQACSSPVASRFAFGVGFGVCFALMIVFTLMYAGPGVGFVDGSGGSSVVIPSLVAGGLGLHIASQWVFTVSVHAHELRTSPKGWLGTGVSISLACVVLGLVGAALAGQRWFDMAPGEVGYRVLLSFYGLVFPAYVWLNMIDLRRRALRDPTRRSLIITGFVIVLASPFYFAGFMLREEPWLAPGLALVILAKLAAGRADPARPLPSA